YTHSPGNTPLAKFGLPCASKFYTRPPPAAVDDAVKAPTGRLELSTSLPHQYFPLPLKEFQPRQRDGMANVVRLPQFLRRLAPVEADPAGGVLLRPVDELIQLLDGAAQRKHFLDDHRLAHGEAGQGVQGLLYLAFFGIDVNAEEIQIRSDLFRNKARSQPRAIQAPVHQADGDQVPAIVLANGIG